MRLVAALLLCCSSAFAQAPGADKKPRPVQVIDISQGAEIEGGQVKPVIDFTVIPERPIFNRMIQVRGSFFKELHDSVDALR